MYPRQIIYLTAPQPLIQPIHTSRKQPAVAAFNECVWVAGGLQKGIKPLKSVCAYDPIKQIWSEQTEMKEKRYGFGLTALDGKLYAIGGRKDYEGEFANSQMLRVLYCVTFI